MKKRNLHFINGFKEMLLFILLLFIVLGCTTSNIQNISLNRTVDLQGHRGARGLRPENTIPAFEFCIDQGMVSIELDTNVTKDKYLVVTHDSIINTKLFRDENKNPAEPTLVKDLTLAELKRLEFGVVPNKDFPKQVLQEGLELISLDEFFDFVKSYEKEKDLEVPMLFNIEVKLDDDFTEVEALEAVRLMVKTIESAGMVSRTTVQSFELDVLPEIKRLNPKIKTSALFAATTLNGLKMMMGFKGDRYKIVQKAIDVGANTISPYHLYVNPEFVKFCHEKDIAVLPWTVNNEKLMRKMLNSGVDGIISDYPDLLKTVYDTWKSEQ